MNARGFRRYIDDLAAGRRPKSFEPDDFEAEQIRTAIDLQAARMGADAPTPGVPGRLAQPPRRSDGRRTGADDECAPPADSHPPRGGGRDVRGGTQRSPRSRSTGW